MILDTVRLVADWLADPTYGVAAKLAALDYDGTDTVPAGTLTIADETRDVDAALEQFPAAWSLTVHAQPVDKLEAQAATFTHDAEVPLLLRLCRTDSDPAAATRDLYYTLRASVQSLEALFNDSSTGAVAARTRNQVQAYVKSAIGQARTREQREDNVVTGAISVTLLVRDLIA